MMTPNTLNAVYDGVPLMIIANEGRLLFDIDVMIPLHIEPVAILACEENDLFPMRFDSLVPSVAYFVSYEGVMALARQAKLSVAAPFLQWFHDELLASL